jgi:hypothetical protein
MKTFDQFLVEQGRTDLVLLRVAPLTSRIAFVVKTTKDDRLRTKLVKDLHELHGQYKECP